MLQVAPVTLDLRACLKFSNQSCKPIGLCRWRASKTYFGPCPHFWNGAGLSKHRYATAVVQNGSPMGGYGIWG